jgi:hypothetical protein
MKRFLILILCCILLMGNLAISASADSMATNVESIINVTGTGDCIVSTNVRLQLDSPADNLTFPVPVNATDITLNGGSARTTKTATAIEVDISRVTNGMTGEFPLMLNYNIPGAIKDSYGNPVAPYLTQNYHKVYVIDYRKYTVMNLRSFVEQYEIDDVIMLNNLNAAQHVPTCESLKHLVK